ncbi:MAG: ATP-binding protein, partial [Lentisphaeria bacterium]|nr:DNA mismatch repair endonuclease MutL [Lentisphaeria bacterium]NQZ69626.1 ATP-binding protein [Lentisphaeria bacterium]
MSIIRVLNEDVSNRIAAGEVIERPASIVKELLENSLDAGATRVHVLIERGGQSLVQVLDNGHGMDKEDALLCLEAHATSKIRDTSDIENIHTMGFRGEALPSIASVCKFTLRTCYKDDTEGTEIRVDGGHIKNVAAIGTAKGTSIACRNLFYNMPARRKFLRTMKTEESHIHEMVLMLALGHPTVGFELSFDGRNVINVQPDQDRRTRTGMLLGRETVKEMLEIDHEENN